MLLCTIFFVWFLRRKKVFYWNRQTVLITGGCSGLGKRILELIHLKCAQTRLICIDLQPAAQEWVDQFDGMLEIMQADISLLNHEDQQKIQKMSPTILINNAGFVDGAFVSEKQVEKIQKTIQVNLVAPIMMTKLCLPNWISQDEGHVVHVSSVLGLMGVAWLSDYCASKSGLIGFHESLRQELKYTNIKTSIVCPGKLNTTMFQHVKNKWYIPTLSVDNVANNILEIIQNQKSVDVWIPMAAYSAMFLRFLSPKMMNLYSEFVGANEFKQKSEAPKYSLYSSMNSSSSNPSSSSFSSEQVSTSATLSSD